MTGTKEMPPTDPNRTESKSLSNNCDSNFDGDKVDGKERGLDDLDGSE